MPSTRLRLYLYAIVDGDASMAAPPIGLDGKPVWLLPFREIAGVVGEVEISLLNDTASAALVHEEVVEHILESRRTLPVRFGTVFSSRQALCDAFDAHYPELLADLVRLDGQVELGLRVFWDEHEQQGDMTENSSIPLPANVDSPGIAYLRAKFAETARERSLRLKAEELGLLCRQTLEPVCTDIQIKILLTPATPISAACLLPRSSVDRAVSDISNLQGSRTDLRFICTGPWPPYHFIGEPRGEQS